MKIVAVSDLHGNIKLYEQLAKYVNRIKCDALIICGDMLPKVFFTTFKQLLNAQSKAGNKIDTLLGKIKCPVLYILGNDDWADVSFKNGICIDSKAYTISGITITGFPYVHTTPFNTNRECTEEELKNLIENQYKELNLEDAETVIFAAHGPMKDHGDKISLGKNVGSKSVEEFMKKEKPLIYLCGHIHEDFGYSKLGDTHVFNCASRHEFDLLNGYIIDINGKEVSWDTIEG